MAAHDLIHGGLSPAVASACASPSGTRGAVLWAVPSHARGGSRGLSCPSGSAAGGGPDMGRLADGVCPTGRHTSGTVSDLWPTPGVHRGHPPWRCAAVSAAWGVCRMTSGLPGRPVRGVVCLVPASWCPVGVGRTISGPPGHGAHACQRCRPGHAQAQRAGCRGGDLI